MDTIQTAVELESRGELDAAAAILGPLALQYPEDLRALVPWYRLLGRLGRFAELEALAPRVWSLALAAKIDTYRILASGPGLNAAAGRQLDALLAANSGATSLWRLRAAVALDVGDADRAEACIEALTRPGARPGDLARLRAAVASFRNDYSSAEAFAREAVANADNPRSLGLARFGLGSALLIQGRLSEGWPHYECRPSFNTLAGAPMAEGDSPWRPEALAGRSLLVLPEQGAGDLLMVVRHALALAEVGLKVTLVAQKALLPLLQPLHPGLTVQAATPDPNAFDFVCPSMSLPARLGLGLEDLPGAVPYLRAPESSRLRWRSRLAALPGLKVGLCWAGAPNMVGDPLRSISPTDLAALGRVPGVSFVRLQVGEVAPEFRGAPPFGLSDWTVELRDYAETAALVSELDLVISICTSVAHLAGGLGVPTWLLNRANSEWRWLLERSDSPWYPTLRIYRQQALRVWPETVQRVAQDLTRIAAPSDPSLRKI